MEKSDIKKAKNDAEIDYIKEKIIFLTQEKEKLIGDRNSSIDVKVREIAGVKSLKNKML